LWSDDGRAGDDPAGPSKGAAPSKGKSKGASTSTGAGMLGFGPQVLTLGQLGGGSKARH
jgi:hypothetical protein